MGSTHFALKLGWFKFQIWTAYDVSTAYDALTAYDASNSQNGAIEEGNI